jgi:hypothetical protein
LLLVAPLKINYRRTDEHPHGGTTEMVLIGRLTDRQRELLANARGRRRPRQQKR